MPSVTRKQRNFFAAEYGRAKRGEKTKTGLPVEKLKHFLTLRKKA